MNIALIHRALDKYGGAERQVLSLASKLFKCGHYVKIFTNSWRPHKCFPNIIKQIQVEYPLFRPDTILTLPRKLKDFDIVNIHNFPATITAYLIKKLSKIPIVWQCNENWQWFIKVRSLETSFFDYQAFAKAIWWFPPFVGLAVLDYFSIKQVDLITVLSNMMKRFVKCTYGKDAYVVRSGIDTSILSESTAYALPHRSLWILTVGRLEAIKRFSKLIKIFSQVRQRLKDLDLKLIFIGDGFLKTQLKVRARLEGVDAHTWFLGNLNDDILVSYYKACDVFVFPSWCPWGLAPLEAMYFGKPCVIWHGAGISEVITDFENGLISYSDSEMVDDIYFLLENEGERKRIGEKARLLAKQYTLDNYGNKMSQFFEEVLKR